MVIVVSVLFMLALVSVSWAVVDVVRRINRRPWTPSSSRPPDALGHARPPQFGSLPTLGPVGLLGGLSPDADITSSGTDEHDLYGI